MYGSWTENVKYCGEIIAIHLRHRKRFSDVWLLSLIANNDTKYKKKSTVN